MARRLSPEILDLSIGEDVTVRPLSETTANDFKSVVRACFSSETVGLVDKLLANPARALLGEIGDIAYERGIPVAVQGAVPCRLYYGQAPIVGVYGSILGLRKNADPACVWAVLSRGRFSRGHTGALEFANTCCQETVSLYSARPGFLCGVEGPSVYRYFRRVVLRPLAFFLSQQKERHPRVWVPGNGPAKIIVQSEDLGSDSLGLSYRRLIAIDAEVEAFWQAYLATNDGLVSSRDLATLSWMFSDRLTVGSAVLIAAYQQERMVGYVILSATDRTLRYWKVADAIALKNDMLIFEYVLRAAIRWIKRRTPAISVTVRGFPLIAQEALSHVFPDKVETSLNPAFVAYFDARLKASCGGQADTIPGWFYGPFDGDACF